MQPPTTPNHLIGVIGVFMAVVSLGLLVSAGVVLYQGVRYGWVKRPPDKTLPGIVEPGSTEFLGVLPEIVGSIAGIIGGFTLYIVLSIVVIVGSAASVLVTGVPIPVQQYLYLAVALSILYTIALQDDVRKQVGRSKWYLGYSTP